jgi:two-component system CheB/CheR fusion protein
MEKRPSPPDSPATSSRSKDSESPRFRIVGIGASAGGLEALELFFSHMPSNSGMAFVVIQHLSPDFKSVMDELLARRTSMRVLMASEGLKVEPNTIYLLPRKTDMTIRNDALILAERKSGDTLMLPIDVFFESLAKDAGERAVGIILSGTGSDGSRGIRHIHQNGGLVFAQSEESAKFDGMPRAAADTEIVDFILSPERMPEMLQAYSDEGGTVATQGLLRLEESEFSAVFNLLNDHHGVDFHSYKPTTMRRRIERRMVMREMRTLEAYVKLLTEEQAELEALYVDLLIGVTRFFRDDRAFERIRDDVLPSIFEGRSGKDEVRAWVCGCASGEEAYSIAILLREASLKWAPDVRIKLFATDVHRRTLDRAARGVYTRADLDHVPPLWREKYFLIDGDSCRVKPDLRQMVVFSEHNLTGDPPFTKIDLVSCRNLLIYLQTPAQRKAIALFHFALNVGGVLMLGPSESLGALEDEFELIDRQWKIYAKRRDVRVFSSLREMPPAVSTERMVIPTSHRSRAGVDARLARAYDTLLSQHMPPSVLVDESRQVLHSFGDVGKYFVRMEGRPSYDFIDMLGGDLRVAVAAAFQRSIKEGRKVSYHGVVQELPTGTVRLNLTIEPVADRIGGVNLYHILFEAHKPTPALPPSEAEEVEVVEDFNPENAPSMQRIRDLELELQYSKEHLQTTVEELETSNEELQATNEELLASNEELQSTNEELHSVNEELYTVNAEYEKKNRELIELNTDIDNLLQSTDIGTLFLDEKLLVRKFTPSIRVAFHLLPQDIGRSIADITYRVEGPNTLLEDARLVLENQEVLDRRVRSLDGRDLLLRFRPYRISSLESAGVVLTFVDVTELTEAQSRLVESEERFSKVANSTPALIWMVDEQLSANYINAFWCEVAGMSEDALVKDGWKEILVPEDLEQLTALCDTAKKTGSPISSEVRIMNAMGECRWYRVSGATRALETGKFLGFILSAIDITDIRNAADLLQTEVEERTSELRQSEEFFRLVGEVATDGYWDWNMISDEIYLSSSLKSVFGYGEEDVPNTLISWRSLFHEEDRDRIDAAFKSHWEKDEPCELVVRGLHKSGSTHWVILRGVALRDSSGKCYRMIGTHTDVTSAKEAETRIRESELRFRRVFETGLVGIGVVDRDLQILQANDRLLEFIGVEACELPIPVSKHCDKNGVALSEKLIAEAREKGSSSIRENSYLRPDGSRITVRMGFDLLHEESAELVIIAEDISREVASKSALKRSEDLLAQAIEATQVGLFDWSEPNEAAGRIKGTPEWFRLFEVAAEELVMATDELFARIHEEDREDVSDALSASVESGQPLNIDFRLRRDANAERSERWIYLRGERLEQKDDDTPRLVGSAQDVTERYAAQASLRLKTDLLQKSNRDLEQFAYIASHDLKEPLRTVTGFLQILQSRFREKLGTEGSEFVHRAVSASNRMHALIDGLLEFSRIGRAEVTLDTMDLREAVDIAVSQLQAAITESKVELEIGDLPQIRGDSTLVARVFLNLIGNSIKFNDGDSPKIRISSVIHDGHVRVFVEDNGIGIDPSFADRVFVIFQRLHTRDEYPGTGIGLSVCRKIMERHGGCIWLETQTQSTLGGTLMGLAFPAAR